MSAAHILKPEPAQFPANDGASARPEPRRDSASVYEGPTPHDAGHAYKPQRGRHVMSAAPQHPGAMVAMIQIPAGAVVVAPAPVLWGAACAGYLGMTPDLARRHLVAMAADPAFAGCVVVLSKRPRELAAPPGDVLRFLRMHASVEAAPSSAPPSDAPPAGQRGDDVIREMGFEPDQPSRRAPGRATGRGRG